MATADNVKLKIQGLIAKSNETTGNADTDLTSAVNSLVDRYGKGGKQNYCLVRFYNDDRTTLLYEIIVPYGTSAVYAGETPTSTKSEPLTEYIFNGFEPSTANVTEDMNCYAVYEEEFLGTLATATWERISEISQAGTAQNYFAIGDTKPVYLKGTVGILELDETLDVYIIGFDHNADIEGQGITFGTFKKADGTDIALADERVNNPASSSGGKVFSIERWDVNNHGGWEACDMRYDILGSTDVAPFGYGSKKDLSSFGYDATPTCATNPVPNTLMAALPADLRAVMKPKTIYTDNTGNNANAETYVTATLDYLPLLAEYEVFGSRNKANEYEMNKQSQYAYYAAGNPKFKRLHSNTKESGGWWLRSPNCASSKEFCYVRYDGRSAVLYSHYSMLVAPIFLV